MPTDFKPAQFLKLFKLANSYCHICHVIIYINITVIEKLIVLLDIGEAEGVKKGVISVNSVIHHRARVC